MIIKIPLTYVYLILVVALIIPLFLIVRDAVIEGKVVENISREEYNDTYLFELVREAMKTYLETGQVLQVEDPPENLRKFSGAFVSMKEDGLLRGSIGYMQPVMPLHEAIIRSAISAAAHDARFIPMKTSELNNVRIEINILGPLRPYTGILEELPGFIEIGTHGLYVSKGNVSGLLLPSVPVDFEWGAETFLERTCNKAGFELDCWQKPGYDFYYFTSEMFRESEKQKQFDEVFGPADTDYDVVEGSLREYLQSKLNLADVDEENVQAVIAPHAGYKFSSRTAAHAYTSINRESAENRTIVIIGPSHFMQLPGIQVLHAKKYSSELGTMDIDVSLVTYFDSLPYTNDYEGAFVREHSLEQQVNFIKIILSENKIVPLVIGGLDLEDATHFAEELAKKNVFLVTSVDFSHYYNLTEAEKLDAKCFESILDLDVDELISDYASGACKLDSIESIIITMQFAKELGLKPKLVFNETSAAFSNEPSSVVGYGAIIFTK